MVLMFKNRLERKEPAIAGLRTSGRARTGRGGLVTVSVFAGALVSLALAAPALGAVPPTGFTPCKSASGFWCGTVKVPVDRSGVALPVTTTITLHVMWKPARVTDSGGALFALAGGPGQAANPFAADFAASLAPALGTRDLVVFDQRGTGANALDCPNAAKAVSFLI